MPTPQSLTWECAFSRSLTATSPLPSFLSPADAPSLADRSGAYTKLSKKAPGLYYPAPALGLKSATAPSPAHAPRPTALERKHPRTANSNQHAFTGSLSQPLRCKPLSRLHRPRCLHRPLLPFWQPRAFTGHLPSWRPRHHNMALTCHGFALSFARSGVP